MIKLWTVLLGLGVLLAGVVAYGGASLWVERTVAPVVVSEPAPPDAIDTSIVAPHKAIYKIEMIEKRSAAQVVNISGDMYFEWIPTCDAWVTDHRFNLLYDYVDAAPMRITSDFVTYEGQAGDSFDFNSRRRRDGELYEELRGRATMGPQGTAGQALYTLPEALKFDLPAGTLFPMGHTLAVIHAARAGKKFFSATIFDGSDEEGPAEVNAFIGSQANAMALVPPSAKIDSALINTPAWNVRMAFFPLKSEAADSDYEMDVVFHDNGVISDMRVEYKDFTVTQKLIALEKAEAEGCAPRVAPPKP